MAKDRISVAEAIERYIDDREQRGLEKATRQTTGFGLETILEPVAEECPDDLTASIYRRAATELAWSMDDDSNRPGGCDSEVL